MFVHGSAGVRDIERADKLTCLFTTSECQSLDHADIYDVKDIGIVESLGVNRHRYIETA